ncbi:hypothetical protein KY326_00275, partial [Candidatus Woesearchaeota archaeon]|nr:hypothetical protein [Candidatus Woesearchaeota archaeon]
MNKKALAFNQMIKIAELVLMVIVLMALYFCLRHSVSTLYDTSSAEAVSYLNNIIYSEQGIMYYDSSIDRVYPGIINNFDSSVLDKSMRVNITSELPAAKLTLIYADSGSEQTIYWNEKWYTRLKEKVGFKGSGSPYVREEKLIVNVLNLDGSLSPAYLTI